MKKLNSFRNTIVALSLTVAALAPGHAQIPKPGTKMNYNDMCMNAANMPKPYGEWDLKGNAKLPEYCKCFVPAFQARAMKALTEMQAGAKPPSLAQSNKEELELRNVCRKQIGLPLAVEPK